MLIFSSSVICASRRAARSSGDNDVFSHGWSCAEVVVPVLVLSIFSLLSSTRATTRDNTFQIKWSGPAPQVGAMNWALRCGPYAQFPSIVQGSPLRQLFCLHLLRLMPMERADEFSQNSPDTGHARRADNEVEQIVRAFVGTQFIAPEIP